MEAREKMETVKDCIFCKIVRGEVPCDKIYEDDHVVAFLDIAPVNKGHTLVVPKKHTENMLTASADTFAIVMKTVQKVVLALEKYADGVNIYVNNKKAAGQVVDHLHVHVIPRFDDDGLKHWPGKNYSDGEARKVAEKIKGLL